MKYFLIIFSSLISLSAAEFSIEGDIAASRIELADVTFYGQLGTNRPGSVYSPTIWGTRVGGAASYGYFRARDHFLWGSSSAGQTFTPFDMILVPAIDGGSASLVEVGEVKEEFRSYYRENDFDLMVLHRFDLCDGLSINPAFGYSTVYLWRGVKSQLEATRVEEILHTAYHGGRAELEFRQQFRGPLAFSITPGFAAYYASTDLLASQEWSEGPIHVKKGRGDVCFRGILEVTGSYSWKTKYVGLIGYIDYMSYIPGVWNPRTQGEFLRLVDSNSLRFGVGATIHFFTFF